MQAQEDVWELEPCNTDNTWSIVDVSQPYDQILHACLYK